VTAPAVTATMPVRRPVLLAATVTDNVATGLILPVLPFIALKLGVGAFAIGPRSNPDPGGQPAPRLRSPTSGTRSWRRRGWAP
jgi:hypothetical protein